MKKLFLIFALFSLICPVFGQNKSNLNKFCEILGRIESNNNDFAVGDNGKAIGRYQIWRVCYQDAKEFNKNIQFSYESLTNKENSDIIVKSYILRYEPNGDFEAWARLWNSGPNWKNKLNKTDKYWARFKRGLTK